MHSRGPRVRFAAMSRVGLLLFPLLAFALRAEAWLAPTARVVGRMEGEFRDHLWIAWLVRHRWLDDLPFPTTFPEAAWPEGLHLYPLDPLNQLGFSLLGALVGTPAAVLAVGTLLSALLGLAGERAAKALGAAPGAALLAGALCMVGPPVLGTVVDGQTEGWGVCWALFAVAELLPSRPTGLAGGLRLGGSVAALVLSAPYQAHAFAPLLVALGLVALGQRRLPLRAAAAAVLVGGLAGGLALGGLAAAESREGGALHTRSAADPDWPPRTQGRAAQAPATVPQVSALTPRELRAWPREPRFLPPTTGPRRDVGWIFPLAALAGLGAGLRAPGSRPRGTLGLIALGALGYALLALGSARDLPGPWPAGWPAPFDLWYRWAPGGHLAWKPAQYAVPAWLLGCLSLACLPPRAALGAGLLVALELQWRGPTPLPLPVVELRPLPAWESLAATPGGAVLSFPCRARSRQGVDRLPDDELLGQLVHGRPLGETHGRGLNPRHQAVLDALAATAGWPVGRAPPLADALRAAVAAGFTDLLLHTGVLSAAERDTLDAALTAAGAVVKERTADGVWWYQLGGPAP